MPAPADSAHAVLLGDEHHPVAVVLHFVQPVGAYGRLDRLVGSENVSSTVLAKKVRQSIDVLDLTRIAHVPPVRTSHRIPARGYCRTATGQAGGVLAQGTNDLSEVVPLLADLLSIPTSERYPPLNLTPQKRKERTLDAQLAQVEGLAARRPVHR
jgi:hypothetical protein